MNRPGEVRAAVEFVLEESAREGALLHGAADGSRMGVMGHSFGGLTTLAALAKQDNPFKAGLAMAPGIRPRDAFDVRDDLPDIIDPIMFMMGEQDVLARYPDLTAAYAILPESTERYAFIFPNGDHFHYGNGCRILFLCTGSLDRPLGAGGNYFPLSSASDLTLKTHAAYNIGYPGCKPTVMGTA